MEERLARRMRDLMLLLSMLLLLFAALHYPKALALYTIYWSQRPPIGPMDPKHYEPVVLLAVAHEDSGVRVKFLRTYAAPGILDITVTAKLYWREKPPAVIAVTLRPPVGSVQELVFTGAASELLECADVSIVAEGAEVVEWSSCTPR